ncbi:DUF167 domain-containing protein [Bartonella sp. B10]
MLHQVYTSGLVLSVYLIPKSSTDKIVGIEYRDDGRQYLIVRLRTVPEDGKANKALIKFLSKQWKIPSSYISLKSGLTSRYKRVHFSGCLERLSNILQSL